MKNRLILFITISALAFSGCNSDGNKASNKVKTNSARTTDSLMAAGDRPDDEQASPTQAEERERIIKSYDNVQVMDATVLRGTDTLHLYIKYYCLKDSTLVILLLAHACGV